MSINVEISYRIIIQFAKQEDANAYIRGKLREAGIQVSEDGTVIGEGTLHWYDLQDKDVRRYRWDPA